MTSAASGSSPRTPADSSAYVEMKFKSVTPPKIKVEKGYIELENGKKYQVTITGADGTTTLGEENNELTKQIVDMLEASQKAQGFTYEDLSKTTISEAGIKTDQITNEYTSITPDQYDEQYQTIMRMAGSLITRVGADVAAVMPSKPPPAASPTENFTAVFTALPTSQPATTASSQKVDMKQPPQRPLTPSPKYQPERQQKTFAKHTIDELCASHKGATRRELLQNYRKKMESKYLFEALNERHEQVIANLSSINAEQPDKDGNITVTIDRKQITGKPQELLEQQKNILLTIQLSIDEWLANESLNKNEDKNVEIQKSIQKIIDRSDDPAKSLLQKLLHNPGARKLEPVLNIAAHLAGDPSKKARLLDDGTLVVVDRKTSIISVNVGKSPKSRDAVEKMLEVVSQQLTEVNLTVTANEPNSRAKENALQQIDQIKTILASLDNSEWGKGVLRHHSHLNEQMALIKNRILYADFFLPKMP